MANGLLLRLRERELSASPAERNVIAFVSAHPHEVVGLSVRGLADGSSKLATMADAVLGVAASEPLVRSGAMASRMAQLMVVDALYAAYVASDYERATHVIKQNYIEKQER